RLVGTTSARGRPVAARAYRNSCGGIEAPKKGQRNRSRPRDIVTDNAKPRCMGWRIEAWLLGNARRDGVTRTSPHRATQSKHGFDFRLRAASNRGQDSGEVLRPFAAL